MSVPTPQRRLFFALWPEGALAEQLEALAGQLGGRRGAIDDLHLTVLFLGRVEESLLPALMAAAAQIRLPAIQQPLTQLESWPKPGVLCAVGDTVAALEKLRRALKELARAIGLDCPVAHEEFRPHVTLRRSYRTGPTAYAPAAQRLIVVAERFYLAESISPHDGRRYLPLASWPLG